MKRLIFGLPILLIGCSTTHTEVRRLSPQLASSQIPADCVVVSIIKDSPAGKAGIMPGDKVQSVNGQVPSNAPGLSDIVMAAPADSDIEVVKKDGTPQHLKIQLNTGHPRLGLVCDLAGWEKPGVTAAGNESVTVFDGPYAFTASGIADKGIIFLRVRITNNGDSPIEVKPDLFTAADSAGTALPVMSPKEVMCYLYGDKGAHLLALKKKQKETLDAHDNVSGETASLDRCDPGTKAHLKNSDPQYAEANAQYLASESLWPASYPSGAAADGLIYLKETTSLPVTLKSVVEGHTLTAKLGTPKGSEKIMKHSELVKFFEAQKRGANLKLTLKKGKVFVGKFATYDSVEERAWFNTPSGGMLNSTSHSLENILYAESLETVPAVPKPSAAEAN